MVSATIKMVMDDAAIEAIVSMLMELQEQDNMNLPLYEQQLKEANAAIDNMLNAIQQGILTRSTKERLEKLEASRDDLEAKIACEKLAKPKVSREFMTFWLQKFRKLDVTQPSHRKMLIDTFINAIYLYDDKMLITFNYKDGAKTVTFDDVTNTLTSNLTGSDLDCHAAPRKRVLLMAYPLSSFRGDGTRTCPMELSGGQFRQSVQKPAASFPFCRSAASWPLENAVEYFSLRTLDASSRIYYNSSTYKEAVL